jgi:exopolysaccharide biosynthesis polyprenyl glycosylphosphotransferase
LEERVQVAARAAESGVTERKAVAGRRPGGWRLREGERRLLLIVGDLLASGLAAFLALALWAQLDWLGFTWEFVRFRAGFVALLPLAWVALLVNLYDLRRAASLRETVRDVLLAAGAGLMLYALVYFALVRPATAETLDQAATLPRRGPLYFLALTTLFTFAWRWVYIKIFSAVAFQRRVLVVGAGEAGRSLLAVVQSHRPVPFQVVGLIDDDQQKRQQEIAGARVLGGSAELLELARREAVSDLVVAIQGPMNGAMFQALLEAQERGIEIVRMPVAYEELLGRVPIQHLEADWVLRSFVDEIRVSGSYLVAKRLMDLLGAVLGLGAFALAFPWVAVAVMIESGWPVMFRQDRLGRGGRRYRVLKVRTMLQDAEADGVAHWAQEQDPRTTLVGRILRRTHLDEFPQFWNVLKGEMSLVGPRPERPELVAELERIIPFYRARLLVKPGLTGWAQVNYGKGASVEGSAEKLEYDLYYIKHRGLVLDLWIILRTLGRVVGFQGV